MRYLIVILFLLIACKKEETLEPENGKDLHTEAKTYINDGYKEDGYTPTDEYIADHDWTITYAYSNYNNTCHTWLLKYSNRRVYFQVVAKEWFDKYKLGDTIKGDIVLKILNQ